MGHLSVEAKEAIVIKAINRGTDTVESIAQINNVGLSTLRKWIRRYREEQPLSDSNVAGVGVSGFSRAEQFSHILATSSLDDVSLGKYCREHGLYSHQLDEWRELFMKTPQANKNQEHRAALKKLKDENNRLQKELRRKDKALAEASALLVMKKKADLIWGVDEED